MEHRTALEIVRNHVAQFCMDKYKSSRLTERGEEYTSIIINSMFEDLLEYGSAIISHHDTKSGEVEKITLKEINQEAINILI